MMAVNSTQKCTAAAVTWQHQDCLQIVYYDGQFDDSRLCVALACTAALAGAAVTNHTEATKLLKVQLTPAYLKALHPLPACLPPPVACIASPLL